MSYTQVRVWRRMLVPAFAFVAFGITLPVYAHVHWSRNNAVDADTIALYHFDSIQGGVTGAAAPLSEGLGLTAVPGSPSATGVGDTAGPIFAPAALALPVAQTLRSTDTVSSVAGDLTVEFWFKWNAAMTSSSLEIGLQSGAKMLIARDTLAPANDRFGLSGTHGSYVSAAGFSNWLDVGEEEASLDEWRHVAFTVHSAGIHYDPLSGHDVYSTGTVGRIYLNGHAVGAFPHSLNLAGLQVHDASRISVMMRGGGMAIDELTLWRRDWSGNGSVSNPFGNGRGTEAAVEGWQLYDE